MILLLIGFVVVVILAWTIWFWGRQPMVHRNVDQGQLKQFFEVLLKRGYDKAFLVIELPSDSRFIQFSKYILRKGIVGLRLGFPLADWSVKYYDPVKAELQQAGILFTIESTGGESVSEFIIVDIGEDLDKAVQLASMILQNVFCLRPTDKVQLYFENVSPRDERVGF